MTLTRPEMPALVESSRPRSLDGISIRGRRPGSAAELVRLPIYLAIEARLPILLIFTVRMVAANGIAIRFSEDRLKATIAWVMLTVAVYVFNGISDVAGDRVNGSTRPLATGNLSVTTASVSCVLLAAGAFVLAWSCGVVEGLLAAAALALGWAYSAGPDLKRSPSGVTFTIFAGAVLTYLAGRQVNVMSIGTDAVLVAFALWVGLCSSAKDFSDIDGDRAMGRRTLPVRLGPVRAARLIAASSFVGFAAVALTIGLAEPALLPLIAVNGIGTAVLAAALLRIRPDQSRHDLRLPYKAFAVTQIGFNLAVILCAL